MTTKAKTKIQPKNVLNLEKLGPIQLNFLKFAFSIKDPLTIITTKAKTKIQPKIMTTKAKTKTQPKNVLNLKKLGPM